MIVKSLAGVLLLGFAAATPAFAECAVPQIVYPNPGQNIYLVGTSFKIRVKHAQNARVEFKFEYRNINTSLFAEPKPYQTDTFTKVADLVDTSSTTEGTISAFQSGFRRVSVRSRCALGQPDLKVPQPSVVSDWSAPFEYIYLDKDSDGIFASVRVSPATFSGPCPVTICADARIQSYFRTPAGFSWMLSDGRTAPGGQLSFNSPMEIKETSSMCFPIGLASGPDWKDPPHSGTINLIVNGRKAFPMPAGAYKVVCAQRVKQGSTEKPRTIKKLP